MQASLHVLPVDLRTYILPLVYGLFGGLAAVAFQKGTSVIFAFFWEKPSQQMPPSTFALFSLATILTASIIAGLILTFVSRVTRPPAEKPHCIRILGFPLFANLGWIFDCRLIRVQRF